MSRFRLSFLGCAAFVSVIGAGPPATAAILPGTTLQDLINAGAAGVTVGDLRFFDFSYAGSSAGGTAPTAAQIAVSDVSGLLGDNFSGSPAALRFSFGWSAIDGEVVDSVISYRAAALPGHTITSLGLQFNGTAFPAGHGTFAAVTETIQRADGEPVFGGNTVGLLNVFSDGAGALPDTHSQFQDIAPCLELILTKDIMVRADALEEAGGVATISWVDNAFGGGVGVPEPASGLVLLIGTSLLMARRRCA